MWGVRFVSIEWVLLIRYSVYVEMFDNQSAISPFFFMTPYEIFSNSLYSAQRRPNI